MEIENQNVKKCFNLFLCYIWSFSHPLSILSIRLHRLSLRARFFIPFVFLWLFQVLVFSFMMRHSDSHVKWLLVKRKKRNKWVYSLHPFVCADLRFFGCVTHKAKDYLRRRRWRYCRENSIHSFPWQCAHCKGTSPYKSFQVSLFPIWPEDSQPQCTNKLIEKKRERKQSFKKKKKFKVSLGVRMLLSGVHLLLVKIWYSGYVHSGISMFHFHLSRPPFPTVCCHQS